MTAPNREAVWAAIAARAEAISESMWISEEIDHARTERDQAYLDIAAKDREIAALREALTHIRDRKHWSGISPQECRDAHNNMRQAARAALEMSGGAMLAPAPDPAEEVRAKCEAIAGGFAHSSDLGGEIWIALQIKDAIAALKGKGEGR